MRLSFIVFLVVCYSLSTAQQSYQNLLDTALKSVLFVSREPIKKLGLDKYEMRWYAKFLRDWSNQKLDTAMFAQIIKNAHKPDTALWDENEIPHSLLVNHRDENVSKKYAIQKLNLKDKTAIRFYKKQVNRFNASETIDRSIHYFSRPVFDDSRLFAVIQWDNGHSWLGGGGGISLYRLENGIWHEVGIISNWRY